MLDETDFDTGELGRQNVKTIVAVSAAVLRQSFSAGHVLHRERKRDRSLRVLVLLDTSTTSRILTNQSTSPTFVRHPPDAGQRRGKRTCLEARHSVRPTGKLFQSLTRGDPGFHSPSQVISRKLTAERPQNESADQRLRFQWACAHAR